jgi:peptide/nickel transport system ATP-binding protein
MINTHNDVLVSIQNLKKHFKVKLGAFGERSGVVHAIDGVSFDIRRGETLGLVGESGCGKSTTGYTIIQLYKPTSGSVKYNGRELTGLTEQQLRPIRKEVQIVFQDPYSTLNPRMTIGDSIAEPIRSHSTISKPDLRNKVETLLQDVGLSRDLADRYPHEFSGGQRQRICIARALAVNPDFVVCDEPVSALDVSIQAQIINLMQDLQEKYHLTYLFIAHDLAVVRHISNRIAVMYLGKIMEIADKDELFGMPLHPYTRSLLSAVPEADPQIERTRQRIILEGDVPSALSPPSGCRFHTRCPIAADRCTVEEPALIENSNGHLTACHYPGKMEKHTHD